MQMRYKSFYALLDERFKRVSAEGLLADFKSAYAAVQGAYGEHELYEYLALMTPEALKEMERDYIIFAKICPENGIVPLIYERKDYYPPHEYLAMCEQTGITKEQCEEIIKATA